MWGFVQKMVDLWLIGIGIVWLVSGVLYGVWLWGQRKEDDAV